MPFHTPAEKAKNINPGVMTGKEAALKEILPNIVSPPTPNRVMKSKKTTKEIT